jgi:hypothetical protein
LGKRRGFAVVRQPHFGDADFRLKAVDFGVGAPGLHDLLVEVPETLFELRDVILSVRSIGALDSDTTWAVPAQNYRPAVKQYDEA